MRAPLVLSAHQKLGVCRKMTDLSAESVRSFDQLSARNDASADACAQYYAYDITDTFSGSCPIFSESNAVSVIGNSRYDSIPFTQRSSDRSERPVRNISAVLSYASLCRIDTACG